MDCPECNHQNPDDANFCEACGYKLNNLKKLQSGKKTNKGAIIALILAIISPLTLMIVSIPAMATGIISLRNIRTNKEEQKGKWLAITSIIISAFFLFILFLWRMDALPIANDYSINDLKSANPEYNHTYELMQDISGNYDIKPQNAGRGFMTEMDHIIALFRNNQNDLQSISVGLEKKAQEINTMWEDSQRSRGILEKINSYPEIADLSEPGLNNNPKHLKINKIFLLFRAYIILQSIEGNHEQAFEELNTLDSITKKLSINARSFLVKIICNDCFKLDYYTMNFLINNPETPNDILIQIQEKVFSLSDEHTSLKSVLIFEYLTLVNEFKKTAEAPKIKYSPVLTMKYNSTLRFMRNSLDKLIAEENLKSNNDFDIWPAIYPDIKVELNDSGKLNSIYYRLYNPVGYLLIETVLPALNKARLTKTILLINSDLLKIVLNARLGKEIDLKARAYGDEYIIDIENKKIFSPGPDGISETQDDIILPINPEVIGLTEALNPVGMN